jgi:hypothetical protein
VKTKKRCRAPSREKLTGPPWPWEMRRKLRRFEAAKYYEVVHGLPFGSRHLENLAIAGRGPEFHYVGRWPIYDCDDLDAYAESLRGEKRRSTRPSKPREAA